MKIRRPHHQEHRHAERQRGFAIIVTVSILVLLAVIAVGLLTLSTTVVRTSSQTSAMSEARSNAKLALLLAIGELQKHAGPDQRVSATGGILSESAAHPHWTGIWDSWKAGDGTPSGSDEASDHATIPASLNEGMHPSYEEHRRDHFRSWLVSLDPENRKEINSAESFSLTGSPSPSPTDNAVQLVGQGTLGTAAQEDEVRAGLVGVTGLRQSKGRYGWWVGDESTKARLLGDDPSPEAVSVAERVQNQQAIYSPDHRVLPGFEDTSSSSQLATAASRRSWELLESADPAGISTQFHSATPHSRGLLCDVREGGMKRDLNGLLNRPISTRDTADSFMLYRFGRNRDQVPIQDLSAYYQLYRKNVTYSSRGLPRGIQISNPDFKSGGANFKREYSNLYRLPVPIKIQFLLSLIAEPRTADEKRSNPRNSDTHKLHIGITPAITLWNPNNVPLSMNMGTNFATQLRFFNLPMAIRWTKEGSGYTSNRPTSLAWISNGASTGDRDTGFTLYYSGSKPVVFEPGQVRVFSLANTNLDQLRNYDQFRRELEVAPGWDPERFIALARSDRSNNTQHVEPLNNPNRGALTFKAGDRISFDIEPTEVTDLANGSALQFFNRQSSVGKAKDWMARQFQLVSRISGSKTDFNRELMRQGLPGGVARISYPAKTGREIMSGTTPFLLVNLTAGCETHQDSNSGEFGGRRYTSRPFLHSSPITGTVFIDRHDADAHYHHGWNWWVQDINSVFEANVSVDRKNNGYFGGGYTPESGSTHIVQQEIPVAPLLSIAALSHTQLGGFSLGNSNLGPGASNTGNNFTTLTASGQGGLFPQTTQAIGNSYAHPHLPPDKAFGKWNRKFSENQSAQNVVFADHSYLANKALWDEFFFSSIADNTSRTFTDGFAASARDVAHAAFKGEHPLPNRRFQLSKRNLSEEQLDEFFDGNSTNLRGIDELASHLMVTGAFNVNSTSKEAWKAVFSSMRGKAIGYLDAIGSPGASQLSSQTTTGTPVGSFSMPNGAPYTGSSPDSSEPDQWTSWRELTDQEIDELSEAIVRQVRERGPFLSLSEFVNRRLSSSDPSLAVKGALQSALDDPDVSINAGFRSSSRQISSAERSGMRPAFPEALEGPVAYGSAAYVDQADVLRGLAGQLTPRGDTFVIRTYGDSLDGTGKVQARAWCEAVVQRIPDYLDSSKTPHLKQSELNDQITEKFGRRLEIVSFRFLNQSEI